MEIENNAFFVTGGGSGLGAATARLLAEAGGNVLIADINDEAGERLAGEIGEKARFVRTDVTDQESLQGALETLRDVFGSLHGLINCAGVGPAKRVLAERVRTRWKTSTKWSRSISWGRSTQYGLLPP